jgi:hypothetical protein
MVLSAKLKLDTSQFAGPLRESAAASGQLAQSVGRISNELKSASVNMGQFNLSKQELKQLGMAFGGMALNIAGASLELAGFNREAGYLKAMGSGALQGAMIGGMSKGLPGAVAGMVIGALSGGAGEGLATALEDQQAAEAETRRLNQAMENLRVGANTAQRAIAGLESADQATATLKRLREAVAELQDRMGKGFDTGDFAGTRLRNMLAAIDQLSAKEAALRASEAAAKQNADQLERSMNIGQSRDTLAAFKVSQSESDSRQGFDKSFESAKTTADRVALVKARMDEFGESAAKLSAILESTTTQADPEAFAAALNSLRTVANEITRLKGLDTKVKPKALLPSEHAAAIPSDSLARIGIFVGGAGNKMESIAERTARATAQSERHLRQMVTKAGNGKLVWA